ncbi:MAG: hypothetical protein R3B49_08825 [Phycisphaerales bacterium]
MGVRRGVPHPDTRLIGQTRPAGHRPPPQAGPRRDPYHAPQRGRHAEEDLPEHADQHHLLRRIPTPPFGHIRDRHVVAYDEYVRTGGYTALKKVLGMKPEDVTGEVKASQLRGRGGAGFPCGVKWTFLPPVDGSPRYLAVNADEVEPGTFKDRLLMDFDPHRLLEGIAICMYACRLNKAYIFIRGEYHHQAHVLEDALKEAYEHGIFGSKGVHNQPGNASADPFVAECYVHRGMAPTSAAEKDRAPQAIEGKRG